MRTFLTRGRTVLRRPDRRSGQDSICSMGFLGAPRPPFGAWIPTARHFSCGGRIPPIGGHPEHAPTVRRDSRRGAGEAISQLVKRIRTHTVPEAPKFEEQAHVF